MISIAVIFAYFLPNFDHSSNIKDLLDINLLSVILAGATTTLSLLFYIWPPKNNALFYSLTIYLLLTATAITVIFNNGGLESKFIVIWVVISVFAGLFSFWGTIPLALANVIYAAIRYTNKDLSISDIITIAIIGLSPLIAGAILWHKKRSYETDSNHKTNNSTSELNELANKSEVIINAIGDGVMTIDSKGLIKLINPAAQELLGWYAQDAIGLNYKSVLALSNAKDEPLDYANDPIQQVLNTNQQIRTNSLSITTKTGKKNIVSLVVSPVGDMGSGIIAVFHDITAEKAAEREQAEFISTASHEMRTPVASIEGYLGLALNPQTSQIDDRARAYIQKAHESAQHLGRLFQDLLDVSKADDGRISNLPKVVNIVKFIRDIVQGLQSKANDKGLRLIYKPMPNDNAMDKNIAPNFLVNLDNDHIREVMNNLIENAIKYTPSGEVSVDITGDSDNIVISVKDSGIGIPAEDISHLFQKFYRVNNKDTREIGGTGLGLYLSRRLVEIMGGRIWADSIYQKGTTFFVELPRISSQEAARLSEQANIQSQQIINQSNTVQPTIAQTQATVTPPQIQPKANNVPRGQALTPEQIAAYVAKQRALAAEQRANETPKEKQNFFSKPQPTAQPTPQPRPANISPQIPSNRLKTVNVPPRRIQL